MAANRSCGDNKGNLTEILDVQSCNLEDGFPNNPRGFCCPQGAAQLQAPA
jgi:hypothetical protein